MDEFKAPTWPSHYSIAGHLELGSGYEDPMWARDAAGWVERYTGHILVARDVTEQLSGFTRCELSAWPILPDAVPVVTYRDSAGATVSLPARVDVSRRPARLLPDFGTRWPYVPADTIVSVTVRAGYESVLQMPPNFNRAMLVLIGAYDADREGGEIFERAEKTARSLCGSYRLRRL